MKNKNKNLLGSIIIADDESTFCQSTAKLLQNEGFRCDCASSGTKALEQIKKNNYDLLIADIKMEGNTNLELIKKLAGSVKFISIILVTAYPSQQTAVDAISLPVTAYLTKPIDFGELLDKVKSAVKINKLHKTIAESRKKLQTLIEQLQMLEMALAGGKTEPFQTSLKNFLEINSLAIDNVFGSIKKATDLIVNPTNQPEICQLMDCKRLNELTEGAKQTIKTLKDSRQAHKSKQLEAIRVKLEKLLKNIQKN